MYLDSREYECLTFTKINARQQAVSKYYCGLIKIIKTNVMKKTKN